MTANVAIDERPEALLKVDQADEARIEQFLDYRHKHVKERLATSHRRRRSASRCWTTTRCWNKLDFLHDQLRTGGLKEQYYPRSPFPSGPNLLQLDMYQSVLPNFSTP